MASFLALSVYRLPICNNRNCVIGIIPGIVFNIKINCFSYFLFQEIGEQQVFDLSDIPTCLSSAKKTCGTFSKITQLPESDQRPLPSNAWKNTRKHPQKKVKGQLYTLSTVYTRYKQQLNSQESLVFITLQAMPSHSMLFFSTLQHHSSFTQVVLSSVL